MLSLSWCNTEFKNAVDSAEDEKDTARPPRPFTTCDYILEMIWNTLAGSCRVITLALFATQYRNWFAGVVIVQIMLLTSAIMYIERKNFCPQYFFVPTTRIAQGIAYTFNIPLVSIKDGTRLWYFCVDGLEVRYPWYVFYWLVTMVMNTILISIWFEATADIQLWYRIPAITYVLVAYSISFIVKTIHTKIREHNKYHSLMAWEC